LTIEGLVSHPDRVAITWGNGRLDEFHSLWLFDNDPAHRDPRNGQRLTDVADLPADPHITRVSCDNGVLRVVWAAGGVTDFPIEWLFRHSPNERPSPQLQPRLWRAADGDLPRRFSYSEVRDSASVRLAWLERIASSGIAFLCSVPLHEGKVLEVAALVGWVRETNYGRLFDVRAVTDPNNLAYTDQALGLHTDNPYRDPVPGLQMLHCLCADSTGGASLFADGFEVAEGLRSQDRDTFDVLASTPVRFEFSDTACHLSAERPMIELDGAGSVRAIHYNSRSIAPLRLPVVDIPRFYRAYRAFAHLLCDPQLVLTTTLAQGDLVVFDNHRVLHGRTAFARGGVRHLQGCYVDCDGLRSGIAVLQKAIHEADRPHRSHS
jgi:gamma-butyrobetaine dioxygenase